MDFTASVLIKQGQSLSENTVFQAKLTSSSQGMVVLRLRSDGALNNLEYCWDDKLTVCYADMYLCTETDYLQGKSFPQAIYNVLFDLPRGGEFRGFEGEDAVYSGNTRSGEYIVRTDDHGQIKIISIEELNLTVDFEYD